MSVTAAMSGKVSWVTFDIVMTGSIGTEDPANDDAVSVTAGSW